MQTDFTATIYRTYVKKETPPHSPSLPAMSRQMFMQIIPNKRETIHTESDERKETHKRNVLINNPNKIQAGTCSQYLNNKTHTIKLKITHMQTSDKSHRMTLSN